MLKANMLDYLAAGHRIWPREDSTVQRTRTHGEHLIDQLLVLASLQRMNEITGVWQEIMKVMKAAWEAAWPMFCDKIKGFSLHFYTWRHGPLSKDLYRVLDSLVAAGLAERRHVSSRSLFRGQWPALAYAITEKGSHVLEQCEPLLSIDTNVGILHEVLRAAEEVGPMDPLEARDKSHQMRIPHRDDPSRTVLLAELPNGTDLIEVLQPTEAQVAFALDDDWFEALDMMLSPEYEPGLMGKHSHTTYEDLFGT